MAVWVLRTPVRAPKANAFCERLIGTIRRECLNWIIPVGEKHVRLILREWTLITIADDLTRPSDLDFQSRPKFKVLASVHRHKLPTRCGVVAKPVLGGLHHEYSLEENVA